MINDASQYHTYSHSFFFYFFGDARGKRRADWGSESCAVGAGGVVKGQTY